MIPTPFQTVSGTIVIFTCTNIFFDATAKLTRAFNIPLGVSVLIGLSASFFVAYIFFWIIDNTSW